MSPDQDIPEILQDEDLNLVLEEGSEEENSDENSKSESKNNIDINTMQIA